MSTTTRSPDLDHIDDPRMKITAETIRWVIYRFTDLKTQDLAELLDVGESTIKRWRGAESRPNDNHFRKIRDLVEMKDLLLQLYGDDPEHLEEWLYTKSDLLDRKMPHDLLKEERNLEPVIQQLSSLVTGTHT